MPRTEEQKITQAPIKVTLGKDEYEVKPLRILKQRAWREKVQVEIGPILDQLHISRIGSNTLITGLPSTIAPFSDKVCDLVFAYAPDLPKDKILEEASEEQIAFAFSQIWDLVFQDFLALLGTAAQLLKRAPASAA